MLTIGLGSGMLYGVNETMRNGANERLSGRRDLCAVTAGMVTPACRQPARLVRLEGAIPDGLPELARAVEHASLKVKR